MGFYLLAPAKIENEFNLVLMSWNISIIPFMELFFLSLFINIISNQLSCGNHLVFNLILENAYRI